MSISLLWWEHEQLIDHLKSREDIWTSPRQHMWMRNHSYDDDTAVLGLVISPPAKDGPFRSYALRCLPMAWDITTCDEYLDNLVRKWTEYGTRRRYVSFLTAECDIEPGKAGAIATGLLALENGEVRSKADGEGVIPTPRELWPDSQGATPDVRYDQRPVRVYPITGGGYLRVSFTGGMLKVVCSLRSDGRYGGGFGGAFEGHIRPTRGDISLAAAFLFGNDVSWKPLTTDQEQYVQEMLDDGNTTTDVLESATAITVADVPGTDSGQGSGAEAVPESEPSPAVQQLQEEVLLVGHPEAGTGQTKMGS